MGIVQGTVEAGFEPLRDVFEAQFDEGQHIGAGVAVYHRGRLVADLWGGLADEDAGTPWKHETMAVSYSTTKGLTATCLHVLADRGLVDYQAPVATYWPEFAQNGKSKITVYHLLTHQAGIPQLPDGCTSEDTLDWEKMIHGIEKLAPVWEPGTDSGYHALNFGWLIGEVVRRVDGRSLGTFLREEICAPLGIDRMYIGAPASEEPNVAKLKERFEVTPEMEAARKQYQAQGGSLMQRSMSTEGFAEVLDSPAGHAAEIPAVSGIMNAPSLARMYACLANYGELDGARLMSELTVRRMSEQQSYRPDRVIVLPVAFSMGYMNGAPGWPQGPRNTSFGHPGFGGSIGFADPEIEMSFGFVCNALTLGLTGAGRASGLADAARACIAAAA
jgi:CubicO group peptidase (beta-lactamase class C family)